MNATKQCRPGGLPSPTGPAGWIAGEPPRGGKSRVIVGRLTWSDKYGGGSRPVLTEGRHGSSGDWSGWMGPDDLAIASDPVETLHIDWWIDPPNHPTAPDDAPRAAFFEHP